jgi:hypothetical protein
LVGGIILFFVGHKHLRLRTLVWVIAGGLLTQMFVAMIMVKMDPSILILHRYRFPGRSGWFTLFFVALFFMMTTYRKKLLAIGKYKIIPVSIILVPLLVQVLLGQNRTTWVILFLMTSYWIIFYANLGAKIRFSILVSIIILVASIGLYITSYGDVVGQHCKREYSTTRFPKRD